MSTHTPTMGETIAIKYARPTLETACAAAIDAAISDSNAALPRVDDEMMERVAKVIAATETKHNDHNYLPDAREIAKAALAALTTPNQRKE